MLYEVITDRRALARTDRPVTARLADAGVLAGHGGPRHGRVPLPAAAGHPREDQEQGRRALQPAGSQVLLRRPVHP